MRAAWLLVFLGACAHAPPGRSGPEAPLLELTRQVIAEVESLRGLHVRLDVRAAVLDDEAFRAAQEAGVAQASSFAHAMKAEHEKHVLAFYDPAKRLILIRARADLSAPEGRCMLAHEIEHAVQHQHFGLDTNPKEVDAALAMRAVHEGESMLVQELCKLRARAVADVPGELAALAERLREMRAPRPAQLDSFQDLAAFLVRSSARYAYGAGFRFVLALYRTGGFALVDRMLAHPPTRSAQVMDPRRYVAGEQAANVGTLAAAPAGFRIEQANERGALQASLLVTAATHRAQNLSGLLGDRMFVLKGADRTALAWSTVFSSERLASVFEETLKQVSLLCSTKTAPEGPAVAREGAKVAFVCGLPPEASPAVVAELLTLPGAPPPPLPPLGSVELAEESPRAAKVIAFMKEQRGTKACYQTALLSNPGLEGTVRMELTVDAAGQIAGARILEDTTGDESLARCLIALSRTWTLDPSAARWTFEYPFLFRREP
jgi:TonB family protein